MDVEVAKLVIVFVLAVWTADNFLQFPANSWGICPPACGLDVTRSQMSASRQAPGTAKPPNIPLSSSPKNTHARSGHVVGAFTGNVTEMTLGSSLQVNFHS
jgi:hypothetical protein